MAEERTLTANFTGNASGFSRAANETIQNLREMNTQLSEVRNSIRQTNTQMRTYERQLEALRRATNNGQEATEEQREEMQRLEDAIAQCNVELGTYQTTQQRLQASIRQTNAELNEQADSAEDVSSKFDVLNSAVDTAAKGMAAAGVAIGAGLTYALTKANEMEQAVNSLSTATDGGEASAEQYRKTIENIYKNNFGDSFKDIADSVSIVKQNLGDLDDTELQNITERAYALRDAFGYDISESTRAARALTQNFGISAEQAYDLMTAGRQRGLDFAGDLLDSLSEYSVQFSKMGFSAEEMFAVMAQGAENGAFNIDKVGDAVKEMSIRVIDGSDSTAEGFALINKNADEMAQKFAAGGESARLAFDETIKALKSMNDPVRQDAAGVALLGTMWEDLGKDVVLSMADITEATFEVSGALDAILDKNYADAGNDIDSLKREIELVLTQLGTELMPTLKGALGEIKEDLPQIAESLKDLIKNAGMVADVLWNMREPVAGIVTAFGAFKIVGGVSAFAAQLGAGITALSTASTAATAAGGAISAFGATLTAAAPAVALVAGALGVLVPLFVRVYNEADVTNDKYNELIEKTEELGKSAEEYKRKAEGTEDIADKYKSIKESVSDTAEQTKQLRDLQSDLIDQYGYQAKGIDLVNGSYQTQIQLLKDLKSENEALHRAEVESQRNAAIEAQNAVTGVSTGIESADLANVLNEWIFNNLKTSSYSQYEGDYASLAAGGAFGNATLQFQGTYRERAADLQSLYEYAGTLIGVNGGVYDKELRAFRDNLTAAWSEMESRALGLEEIEGLLNSLEKQGSNQVINANYDPTEHYKQKEVSDRQAEIAFQKENNAASAKGSEEEYKAKKQLLSDQYSVDEISGQEYYDRLKELRDQYLESKSHEWYQVTKELNNLAKSLGETSDHTDKLNDSLSEAKKQQDSLIAAIDRELELRGRKNEDDEYSKKINELNARLNFEKLDDFSRMALEQEKSELVKQREDVLFQRMAEDAKAQINADYKAYEQTVKDAIAGKATNTFAAEVAPLKLNYDPTAWEGMVNSMFSQYSEAVNVNTPRVTNKPAPVINNNYITIQADDKTPKQIYEEIAPYIGGGI